jgi:ATP-binding cassette subfamily F protein uup
VNEYVGGYDDWLRQRAIKNISDTAISKKAGATETKTKSTQKKLGFKEKRELETLPQQIEELETEQQQLHQTMASPDFYQKQGDEAAAAKTRLEVINKSLAEAYQRWEELEEQQG